MRPLSALPLLLAAACSPGVASEQLSGGPDGAPEEYCLKVLSTSYSPRLFGEKYDDTLASTEKKVAGYINYVLERASVSESSCGKPIFYSFDFSGKDVLGRHPVKLSREDRNCSVEFSLSPNQFDSLSDDHFLGSLKKLVDDNKELFIDKCVVRRSTLASLDA